MTSSAADGSSQLPIVFQDLEVVYVRREKIPLELPITAAQLRELALSEFAEDNLIRREARLIRLNNRKFFDHRDRVTGHDRHLRMYFINRKIRCQRMRFETDDE